MDIYHSKFVVLDLPFNPHYLNRYLKIIQIYKDRNLVKLERTSAEYQPGAFHSHHIVPKDFVKDESLENKVIVSPKEHFVLHWILRRAFQEQEWRQHFGICVLAGNTMDSESPVESMKTRCLKRVKDKVNG